MKLDFKNKETREKVHQLLKDAEEQIAFKLKDIEPKGKRVFGKTLICWSVGADGVVLSLDAEGSYLNAASRKELNVDDERIVDAERIKVLVGRARARITRCLGEELTAFFDMIEKHGEVKYPLVLDEKRAIEDLDRFNTVLNRARMIVKADGTRARILAAGDDHTYAFFEKKKKR